MSSTDCTNLLVPSCDGFHESETDSFLPAAKVGGRMLDATCDPSHTSSVSDATPTLTDAQAPASSNAGLPSGGSGLEATFSVGDDNGHGSGDLEGSNCPSGKRKRSVALVEEVDEARGWSRQRIDDESDGEIESIHEETELTAEEPQEHSPSDDGDASSREAVDGVPPANDRRLSARIYLPDDEELMEAVVEGITRGLRPLYKNLHRTLGGRFKNERAFQVKARVYWLRDLWMNPAHPSHANMTPKLKSLVARYADLSPKRSGTRVSTLTTNTCRPRRSARLETGASNGQSQDTAGDRPADNSEDEQFPPLESSVPSEIDSELEEKVARIVLKHSPGFFAAPSKLVVWQVIAVESRGRYKTASSAQGRTLSLCKIATSPHHPKHRQITPVLRRMLRTILKHFRGETTPAEVRATIDKLKDTLLMELVLRKRPFQHDGESKAAVWADIVASVKYPVVVDVRSAEKRVIFLTKVLDNRQHAQHANLTKRLRFLLRKYKRVVANVTNPASRLNARTPQRAAADTTMTPSPAAYQENRDETLADVPETDTRPLSTPSVVASPPSEFVVKSLTTQVAKLESEQKELRGELRELHDEMHSQRECHHRKTTAMLELLEKERQDRKDEFMAMIGLLTRFGVPQAAPHATSFTQSGSKDSSRVHSIENCVI